MNCPTTRSSPALKATAKEFSDAVRQSRALPAMAEAAEGLNRFQGTEGSAKSAEAAEVLKSFVAKCRGNAQGAGLQCELAFGPTLQLASQRTICQMLGRRGGNVGYGGEGSGANGYSMRSSAPPNVGLYGPETLTSNKSSGGGRDSRTAADRRRAARRKRRRRDQSRALERGRHRRSRRAARRAASTPRQRPRVLQTRRGRDFGRDGSGRDGALEKLSAIRCQFSASSGKVKR